MNTMTTFAQPALPATWRIGTWQTPEHEIDESTGAAAWQVRWMLKRPCALSPRQLLLAYLGLSAVSLGVALSFWFVGAALVLPFACLEVFVLGVAMLAYARHATDRDIVALSAHLLRVERHRAGRVESAEFHPCWVRVGADRHDGALLRLSSKGASVSVGQFVQRHQRQQVADELRWALRHLLD